MSYENKVVQQIGAVRFSDVNMNYVQTSAEELVFDADSVQNSVLTILSTPVGARPFNREFGSNVHQLLFDPMDATTENRIKSEVIDAIRRWETRIVITRARVLADYQNAQYFIEMIYTVPQLNDKVVTLTFNLVQN